MPIHNFVDNDRFLPLKLNIKLFFGKAHSKVIAKVVKDVVEVTMALNVMTECG